MEEIIIQEQITITEEEWNNIIKDYGKLPDTYGMGIGGKMLDKKGIINEIKKLTDIGKQILVMKCKFKEWLHKSLSTDKSGTELSFKVPSAKASDKPCPKCFKGYRYTEDNRNRFKIKCNTCKGTGKARL